MLDFEGGELKDPILVEKGNETFYKSLETSFWQTHFKNVEGKFQKEKA